MLRADIRVQHRDGSLRWCQISLTNQLDDPVIEGIVVNVHDITERREAEASVAAAEARFRTLVQHAADGIIILDLDARCSVRQPVVRTADRAAARRRSSATSCASTCIPTTSRADRRRVGAHARAPRRDDARARCACATPTAAGTGRRASISNRLDDPTIAGIILNVRDVTERKALDDLLAEESRILEMIAWGERLETVLDRVATLTARVRRARATA